MARYIFLCLGPARGLCFHQTFFCFIQSFFSQFFLALLSPDFFSFSFFFLLHFYWCYYLYMSSDSVSPVCGTLFLCLPYLINKKSCNLFNIFSGKVLTQEFYPGTVCDKFWICTAQVMRVYTYLKISSLYIFSCSLNV